MTQTMLVYGSTIISSFLFAQKARMSGKRKWVLAIITVLSLVAGLRAKTVGIDAGGYADRFELIVGGRFAYVWGVEKTFKYVMLLVSKVFHTYTGLFLFCSFLTNSLIVLRLWDFRKLISFEWAVVVYYTVFYFYSFNIMRQMCAVAIVFWASRYIERRQYTRYLVCVMLAYLFHASALLGIVLLLSEFLNWRYLSYNQKCFLAIVILCLPLSLFVVTQTVNLSKYAYIFRNVKIDIGIVLIAKILFFFFSSIGLKQNIINDKTFEGQEKKTSYIVSSVKIYYLLGLIICSFAYIYRYADRISLFLYIFECIYIGIIMKYKAKGSAFRVFPVLLYGAIIFLTFRSGGQGQIPYLFYWQV